MSDTEYLEGLNAESLDVPLHQVLSPETKADYVYDFGTWTELTLRVVSERDGEPPDEPVRILARNDPPDIRCGSCGEIATQVCTICHWRWLCDECALDDRCGEGALLPVVNSPRVGMCGYTGQPRDA